MDEKKWYQNKKTVIIVAVALVAVVGIFALAVAELGGSSGSDFATVTTFPDNEPTFGFVTDGNAYADEGLTFPAETTTSVTVRDDEYDDYYGYDYDDEYDEYDDYYEDDYYDDDSEDDYYEDDSYEDDSEDYDDYDDYDDESYDE